MTSAKMEVNKIITTLVLFYMVTVTYSQMTGTGNSPITALGQNPLAGGYGNFQRPAPVYPGGRGMTPGLSANKLTLLRLLNPEFGKFNLHQSSFLSELVNTNSKTYSIFLKCSRSSFRHWSLWLLVNHNIKCSLSMWEVGIRNPVVSEQSFFIC